MVVVAGATVVLAVVTGVVAGATVVVAGVKIVEGGSDGGSVVVCWLGQSLARGVGGGGAPAGGQHPSGSGAGGFGHQT